MAESSRVIVISEEELAALIRQAVPLKYGEPNSALDIAEFVIDRLPTSEPVGWANDTYSPDGHRAFSRTVAYGWYPVFRLPERTT